MSLLIILILFSYILVCTVSYLFLRKIKYQISYHLGMNLAMTSSGIMGIAIGTLLVYGFPGHYTLITIITTIIAILVGVMYGALVDYQTLLSGVSSGIMSGLMGPMIGMAADIPLVAFCTILLYASFALLCFSVRS